MTKNKQKIASILIESCGQKHTSNHRQTIRQLTDRAHKARRQPTKEINHGPIKRIKFLLSYQCKQFVHWFSNEIFLDVCACALLMVVLMIRILQSSELISLLAGKCIRNMTIEIKWFIFVELNLYLTMHFHRFDSKQIENARSMKNEILSENSWKNCNAFHFVGEKSDNIKYCNTLLTRFVIALYVVCSVLTSFSRVKTVGARYVRVPVYVSKHLNWKSYFLLFGFSDGFFGFAKLQYSHRKLHAVK